MNFKHSSSKDIGIYGEKVALAYIQRLGFTPIDTNVSKKTGEIDLIAKKEEVLHFIEVKSLRCIDFPVKASTVYAPSQNLHKAKLRRVVRTSEWYMASIGWEGEFQIDGIVVWIRERDGVARVRFLPHLTI